VLLLDPEGRPADEGELCLALEDPGLGRPLADCADSAERTGEVAQRDTQGYIT
jgi:hypothetical protein